MTKLLKLRRGGRRNQTRGAYSLTCTNTLFILCLKEWSHCYVTTTESDCLLLLLFVCLFFLVVFIQFVYDMFVIGANIKISLYCIPYSTMCVI